MMKIWIKQATTDGSIAMDNGGGVPILPIHHPKPDAEE